MALTKQQYASFVQGNYQIYVDMFNQVAELMWWMHINSVDDAWDNVLICKQDWTFINMLKRIFLWQPLFINTMDCSMQQFTKCATTSFADKSRAHRTWLNVLVPKSNIWERLIFLRYNLLESWLIAIEHINEHWYFRQYTWIIIQPSNWRMWQMPDRFDSIIESWEEDYDMMEKELDKLIDLWFVDSFSFISDKEMSIIFKEYKLWLWYWAYISMPKMPLVYNFVQGSVRPWDHSYIHPHTNNSSICLWSMQDAIYANRYNFEFLCLTLLEWVCTYNRSSPYNNICSDQFLRFTSENHCKLIYWWEEEPYTRQAIESLVRKINHYLV